MSYRTHGPRDSAEEVAVKADWGQGVNTVLPADRLPQFQFTHGLNIELREGFPVTRRGDRRANWLYINGAALGEVFQGAGLIESPAEDPVERLPRATLVVCDNNLWLCCPNNEPQLVEPDITDDLQPVEIIDAFDEALILRNLSQVPVRFRYVPGGFVRDLPVARPGLSQLPAAATGCYAGTRVWLKVGKSDTVASDLLEWDYLTVQTRYKVDDGENDEIVRYWPVGENRIVVFKTRSVHVLEGIAALDTVSDPPVQINQYRVAAARGCVAPYAIAQRGQSLYYLSRDGIEVLALSEAAVSAQTDQPISLAVLRYFEEMRWRAVRGARMAIADNYLLLSVPTRWGEADYAISIYRSTMIQDPPPDFEPPEPPTTSTRLCGPALTWLTYGGSGTWCGFKGFFTLNEGITPRYLTVTVKGEQRYYNNWPWGEQANMPATLLAIRAWVAGDDLTPEAGDGIQTFWSGSASYDPETGCSLANGIEVYRRTNGNPYPFIMSYGFGPAEETGQPQDVDNPFSALLAPGFAGGVVTGSNSVFVGTPDERNFIAWGYTVLGNQLGSHTVVGQVRERFSNEHSLFAQLVIDGAAVTSTKSSELVSFDDDTGVFEGTVSAFTFTKPTGFNELGVKYTVSFVVNVTVGAVTEARDINVEYTGTGVAVEQLTVPLPVYLPGTLTEWTGECITIFPTMESTDGYETYPLGADYYELPQTADWPAESDMTCGVGVSSDGYEDLPLGPLFGEPDCGHCWAGPLEVGHANELESYEGYEDYPLGLDLVVLNKGFGWAGYGDIYTVDYSQSTEGYEDYTLGPITVLDSIDMWGGLGDMATHPYDDEAWEGYEDYTLGAIAVLDGGDNWAGDGDIEDI